MTLIPKIVHQTSPTKSLTFEERQLRRRIRKYLPDWDIRLWDDADNDEAICKFFPDYHVMYQNIRLGVVKADIARIMYMYVYGGFYFDTDYKILRTFNDEMLEHDCIIPISRDNDIMSPNFRVGNCILASKPNYEFWKEFLDHCFTRLGSSGIDEHQVETVTGPEGLTAFYLSNRHKYPHIYLPVRNDFHPLIKRKGLSWEKGHNSYGAHLCWGSWRTKSWDRRIKTLLIRKTTCF